MSYVLFTFGPNFWNFWVNGEYGGHCFNIDWTLSEHVIFYIELNRLDYDYLHKQSSSDVLPVLAVLVPAGHA